MEGQVHTVEGQSHNGGTGQHNGGTEHNGGTGQGQDIIMEGQHIMEGQVQNGGTGQIRGQSGKRERMEKDLEQGEAFELRALRGLGIEIKLARVPKRRIKKSCR